MALRVWNQNRWRLGKPLAAAAAVGLMIAACGGEDESSDPEEAAVEGDSSGEGDDDNDVDGDWQAILDAAEAEGSLTIGMAAGPGYEAFAQYAQEQLPDLAMEFTFVRPSDFVGRAISEQDSGAFLWDLYFGGITNVYGSLQPDYLEPIMPVLDDIPDDVKRDEDWGGGGFETFTDPDDPRTFIHEWSIEAGIYINRDLAPDFSEPQDLLDPQYQGMIGLYDPRLENQTSQSLAWFMESEGEEFVRDIFREQEPQISGDQETLAQWIVEGRVALALGARAEAISEFQEAGVGTSVERNLDMGMTLSGRGFSVLREPPNPNAVRVFTHWFLSQDGQDAWARLSADQSNTRRLDADPSSYSDNLPDYDSFDEFPIRPGTVESGDQLTRAIEIVNEFLE